MRGSSLNIVKGLFIVILVLALPAATICRAQSNTQLSPAAKAGQKVFEQQCTLCHYADQTKNKIGPGLKGGGPGAGLAKLASLGRRPLARLVALGPFRPRVSSPLLPEEQPRAGAE